MLRLITEQAADAILTLHRVAEQEAEASPNRSPGQHRAGRGRVQPRTRLTLRATEHQVAAVTDSKTRDRPSLARRRGQHGRSARHARAVHRHFDAAPTTRSVHPGVAAVEPRRPRRAQPVQLLLPRIGRATGELIQTHSNSGDNFSGEQEKLMAFCLAGGLSCNLASPTSDDNRPMFSQLST